MKKNLKKIISVLTAIAVVGTVNYFPQSENFNIKNLIRVSASSRYGVLNYGFIDDEVVIVGLNDWNAAEIEIPSEIEGYSVTGIESSAFYNCTGLTSITIPNSVTSIGEEAFFKCSSLKTITIPNSVISIGKWAFASCISLETIEIPDSVTSIGENAFSYCSSLKSITIPKSVDYIGNYALSGGGKREGIYDFKIYGYLNSEAQNYAVENAIEFLALDSDFTPVVTTSSVTTIPVVTTAEDKTQIDGLEFYIGSISGKPGDIVEVPLNVKGNENGLSGMNFEITYDRESLELLDCYASDLPGSWVTNGVSGYIVFVTLLGNNEKGDGEAGLIEFKIKENAKAGSHEIGIGYAKYAKQIDATQKSYEPKKLTSGKVFISEGSHYIVTTVIKDSQLETMTPVVTTPVTDTTNEIPTENNYDLDGNGTVTPLDLVKMKKQILGYETQYAQTADVNNDGKVDAKDLSAMVKYLLEN